MGHHRLIILAMLSLLMLSCGEEEQPKELQSLMEASKNELAEALEERDSLLELVKEVAAMMEHVRTVEDSLGTSGSAPEDLNSRVSADVRMLCRTLQQRRRQLAGLEENLKESVLYTDELKGIVTSLRRRVDGYVKETAEYKARLTEADGRIGILGTEVDSLNNLVVRLTESLDAATESSARYEREANTCRYIVAKRPDLKRHRIIRGARLMRGEFDKDCFTTGDKRKLRTIELNSSVARIRTPHPDGSYEIAGKGRGKVLNILEPDRFWELTSYLVVQTD
ncbi:MAG: hypothetical protein NC308_06730 [Clostridium sp.]|nr:hypothetical protein [Bacteroides sp.]MCM1198568.1 hypothetical protein [Clostridium sp.]